MNRKILLSAVVFFAAVLTFTNCNKDGDDDDTEKTPLELAKEDYKERYEGTAVSDPLWTGATAGCNAGDISADARQKVATRVNYYRALVGLPDNITINSSQSQKCQEAALYMIANQTLTHFPSQSGNCFTQGAYDAASQGNVAYSKGMAQGNHTVNAVSGYMEDPGDHNKAVGHRSWILYPQLSQIGSGSVWRASDMYATDCMMWGGNMSGSAPTIDFVAYPPNGFIPSTLLFPRWSFSIQGANFNSADVTMTDEDGNSINLNVIHRSAQGGAPDAIIVWEPSVGSIPANVDYKSFNVNVTGVQNAPKTSYSYTVKAFYVTGMAKKQQAKNAFSKVLAL